MRSTSMAATKRGSHLMLSLERLETETQRPFQRIGLSATQRPLEEIARFLGGFEAPGRPRDVTVVDAGVRKQLDLEVIVPIEDMSLIGRPSRATAAGARPILDLALDPPRAARPDPRAPLDDRVRQQPAQRRAPRREPERARRGGDRARPPRLARARAARRGRGRAQGADGCPRSSPPRRWSSGSTWARSTSWCRSRRPTRSRAGCSGSAAPVTRSARPASAS